MSDDLARVRTQKVDARGQQVTEGYCGVDTSEVETRDVNVSDVGTSYENAPDANTSDDAFLDGRVQILQPQKGYRAGLDALMLAAAAPIDEREDARVLDAGAGVGAVGLCVAARCSEVALTLVEREPELCALAVQNLQRNGWAAQSCVLRGDLTGPAAHLVENGLMLERYDHVLANPPYFTQEKGTPAMGHLRAGARAMPGGALERWAKFLAACARPGGTATVIYRADDLQALLASLSRRFGSLKVLPVHAHATQCAQRVIVQGIKGSRGPLAILPGFVVHDEENRYTAGTVAILRHGASLPMTG